MLILSSTDHALVAQLGSAPQSSSPKVVVSSRVVAVGSQEEPIPQTQTTALEDTDAAVICAAPATQRRIYVDYISIHNDDTESCTVTLSLRSDGVDYHTWTRELDAGATAAYTSAHGWAVT